MYLSKTIFFFFLFCVAKKAHGLRTDYACSVEEATRQFILSQTLETGESLKTDTRRLFANLEESFNQKLATLSESFNQRISMIDFKTSATFLVLLDSFKLNLTRVYGLIQEKQQTSANPQNKEAPLNSACLSVEFKDKTNTPTQDNIVKAGFIDNNLDIRHRSSVEDLYVCRAFVKGRHLIGKASSSECWITYNNKEIGSKGSVFSKYEILTNPMNANLVWKSIILQIPIPTGSILGSVVGNQSYYIGRVQYQGKLIPGAINGKTLELTISEAGKVYKFPFLMYEILTCS